MKAVGWLNGLWMLAVLCGLLVASCATQLDRPKVQLAAPQSLTPHTQPLAVLRMQFVGANPNSHVASHEALSGQVNYFIGNDPDKWSTNIPTFAKVQYQDVYPGVDVVYYGNQQQLEFDFVVAPSADSKAIRLALDGLVGAISRSPLQITENGDLSLPTDGGEVRLRKPLIYQETNGVRQPISGYYVIIDSEISSQSAAVETGRGTAGGAGADPDLWSSRRLGGGASGVAAL